MYYFPDRKNVSDISRSSSREYITGRDYLTEVSVRAAFKPFLSKLLSFAKRHNKVFSLVFMDLDRFKKYNDKYGHLFGDEILKYVGSSLRLTFQDIPCRIFRYGGDEFIIVFPDKTPREAKRMVQLLKYNMSRRPILFMGKFFKISASYGIAGYPNDGMEMEDLVKRADMAQYSSKGDGHNVVTLANGIRSRKLYRAIMLFCIVIIYAMLVIVSKPLVANFVDNTVGFFSTKIADHNQGLDAVTLKNGTVLRGVIVHETYQSLTMNRMVKGDIRSLYIDKSEIQNKKYGNKTGSDKRFAAFIKANPNPHRIH